MLTDDFAPRFLTTVNRIDENPVHLLFNQWWADAPADVRDAYTEQVLGDPAFREYVDDGYYAPPLDLERLGAMPETTLGRAYHDWIVDNGLTAQIATDYGAFHERLAASGALDGMPPEMQYMVLRGFQVHDFLHVLTGYDSSGLGEISLQAFCLAQVRFPYFAMWISTVTTQMTFLRPSSIVPLMDAITDGWQRGRSLPNLQTHRWEDEVERPLAGLRADWGINATVDRSAERVPT